MDARPTRGSLRERAAGNASELSKRLRRNPTPRRRLCGAKTSPTCGLWHLLNLIPASSCLSASQARVTRAPRGYPRLLRSQRILDVPCLDPAVFCSAIYWLPPSLLSLPLLPATCYFPDRTIFRLKAETIQTRSARRLAVPKEIPQTADEVSFRRNTLLRELGKGMTLLSSPP